MRTSVVVGDEDVSVAVPPAVETRWNVVTRIAFRFCFVYLLLFCLDVPQMGITLLGWFGRHVSPMNYGPRDVARPVVEWTGTHVLGMHPAPQIIRTGSGDTSFDWAAMTSWLLIGAIVTAVWSVLDRKRAAYPRLHPWFRVGVRFLLASQLFMYGTVKFVPLQMPEPGLAQMLTPVGQLNRMSILWTSIGASHPYEIATGCAELLAALLLIVPRTAMLGALVAAVDMTQVFVLNMTYDIPVKILSFHLLVMSAILLAPDARRLVDVFLADRPAGPSAHRPLFARPAANHVALGVQIVFGLFVFGSLLDATRHDADQAHRRSPWYGVWNVEAYSVDGQELPPLTTDGSRWRRTLFDGPPTVGIQYMDDRIEEYPIVTDPVRRTITIAVNAPADVRNKAVLSYVRPADDRLILDGELNGRHTTIRLSRLDRPFPLKGPGFRWIHNAVD